jgi:hypothetical protein
MRFVGADLVSALYSYAFSLYFYASAHNSEKTHKNTGKTHRNTGKTYKNKGQTQGLPLRFRYFTLSLESLNFQLSPELAKCA